MTAATGRSEPCPCGSGRKFQQCCLQSAAAAPRSAQTDYDEGNRLQEIGRFADAARSFRAAIALRPGFVEAHVNLGNVLESTGRIEDALACYERALRLRPQFVELRLNIGAALQAQGRADEAIAQYRAGLLERPADARLHNNLAMVLRESNRRDEAEASFRAALALEPGWPVIRHGLGGLLHEQGRFAEAEVELRSALALDPGASLVRQSLADTHLALGRWEEAMAGYRHARKSAPQSASAFSGLLLHLLYSEEADAALALREHRRFGDRFAAPLERTVRHRNAPDPARRVKIGYVSADFRNHSVAYFLEPVLACHDRTAFEIHCYSSSVRADAVTARLRALADVWIDCAQWSDAALAERILADRIDVLVDLSGHTAGNRLLTFARKPAPLQLSWIGYSASSGLREIDGFVTDTVASLAGPAEASGGESEALIRLPRIFSCYRPPAYAPEPGRRMPEEAGAIAFGSFNNAAKISSATVALWSAALRALPSARLVLKDSRFKGAEAARATATRFAAQGIDSARIEFLPRTESDSGHLEEYSRIDIALDTHPYAGVTTTCEALWMGVPVVTLAGTEFRSRTAASLLTSIGHPDWVARDHGDFVQRVLELAADPGLRARLRRDLRTQMRNSPLTDEAGLTRDFESTVRDLWSGWCLAQGARAPGHP